MTFIVEANEKTLPVNICEGDILAINEWIQKLIIHKIATVSKNGYAAIETQNSIKQIITVILENPSCNSVQNKCLWNLQILIIFD